MLVGLIDLIVIIPLGRLFVWSRPWWLVLWPWWLLLWLLWRRGRWATEEVGEIVEDGGEHVDYLILYSFHASLAFHAHFLLLFLLPCASWKSHQGLELQSSLQPSAGWLISVLGPVRLENVLLSKWRMHLEGVQERRLSVRISTWRYPASKMSKRTVLS